MIVCAAITLVCAAGFSLVALLALRVPPWFSPAPVTAETSAIGEGFERRVLSEVSAAHRFNEPWTLSLTSVEAEAWLNGRLPTWLENQGAKRPGWFGAAGVSFAAGEARVGVGVAAQGGPPVISLVAPTRTEGAPSLRVGTLPAPKWFAEWLAPGLHEQLDKVRGQGEPAGQGLATFRLDDGRRVRITGIEATEGTLTLHCVTLGKSR